MIHFNLIQCIGRDMLRRLLQITDSAGIPVQIDNSIQPVGSQNTFIFLHTDPFQNFRKGIPGKDYLLFLFRVIRNLDYGKPGHERRADLILIVGSGNGIYTHRGDHALDVVVCKAQIVQNLKNEYDVVIMTGDGINDLSAMKAADVAILTVQQDGTRPEILFETADYVIENICEAARIIQEMAVNSETE